MIAVPNTTHFHVVELLCLKDNQKKKRKEKKRKEKKRKEKKRKEKKRKEKKRKEKKRKEKTCIFSCKLIFLICIYSQILGVGGCVCVGGGVGMCWLTYIGELHLWRVFAPCVVDF